MSRGSVPLESLLLEIITRKSKVKLAENKDFICSFYKILIALKNHVSICVYIAEGTLISLLKLPDEQSCKGLFLSTAYIQECLE